MKRHQMICFFVVVHLIGLLSNGDIRFLLNSHENFKMKEQKLKLLVSYVFVLFCLRCPM